MKNFLAALQGAGWAAGVFFCFLGVMSAIGYMADHVTFACTK